MNWRIARSTVSTTSGTGASGGRHRIGNGKAFDGRAEESRFIVVASQDLDVEAVGRWNGRWHRARQLVLKAFQDVAAILQLRDEIRRYKWTQLDLNRTLALVIEQLERIEILVNDRDSQPEPEHLVHR